MTEIPDLGFITSSLEITESLSIQDIRVFVSISHRFRGDLVVSLTSPAGTTVVLHNRTGGFDSDLIGTFGTNAFAPAYRNNVQQFFPCA
jgi:subtilisin-like proprotein convertase family protein